MSAPTSGPSPSPSRAAARAPELPREIRDRLPELDADALAAFFDHYFERVHGYLRRLVREEHLAEDLTQEVFLHVHRSLPSYDPSRPLSPWVYTIATNKVRDHWRSRQSQEDRRAQSVDDEESAPVLTDGGGGPTTDIEAGETAGEVADAVAALPEMLRQTFVLRYYEGLSFEEIGRMVERNEAAVRKRYSRALAERPGQPRPPGLGVIPEAAEDGPRRSRTRQPIVPGHRRVRSA